MRSNKLFTVVVGVLLLVAVWSVGAAGVSGYPAPTSTAYPAASTPAPTVTAVAVTLTLTPALTPEATPSEPTVAHLTFFGVRP